MNKQAIKKCVAVAISMSLALSVVGCTAADTASQQVQVAADNFEVVRELTVFDNCTGQILFVASGRMSVSVDPNKERLEVMVAQPGDKYEKHFIGLNETTTYIVRDISGVNVENYRYKLVINPDMLLPFETSLVTGGSNE